MHSVEASCAFVWPVASALLLSHIVSVGRHGVGIHMLYAFITQPFMKVCFVDLGVIFLHVSIAWYPSELLRGGKSKQTNIKKNKRIASLRDTLLHVSQMERSFFLPLHLCFSGLYRFCFSRKDGCGLLKASTHRPTNCSITMGTGVNQEFIKARGFQFMMEECVRTCVWDSISLPLVLGGTYPCMEMSFEFSFLATVVFIHMRSCVHRFQTSLVSQLDSPNPTCNLWMYLHLHKLKQNVISMLNVF